MGYSIEEVSDRIAENMPSLSPTASKVMELANDLNAPPGEITKVIKLDPVLSAKVLKLVNSSYFALSNNIVSLEKAVILLGLNTIKNLALSAAVLTQMESHRTRYPFDNQDFWKHSLAVGVTARMIAQYRNIPKKTIEDYFIGGLLHDLGILVECQMYPEEMKVVCEIGRNAGLLESEEVALEGLNHCVIGKVLAERWKLSSDLSSVIAFHHKPLEADLPNELTMSVCLANNICKNNGIGLVIDRTPINTDSTILEKLSLPKYVETEILKSLEEEISKAMEFLKL